MEINREKKNATDFALWKFSNPREKRQMEWESPWGVGFPGWHIECAAMSNKYLAGQLDIHCGGVDHINVHHTNEIAQAEAATGKKFFNFWIHGEFLNISGGKKMAKSKENFLTLENAIVRNNINPLAYRYAAMLVHYRKPMEFSLKSIKAAENALNNLYDQIRKIEKTGKINKKFKNKFLAAVNDDLNMPGAMAVVWNLAKSNLNDQDKKATLLNFDKVLGLDLDKIKKEKIKIPDEVKKLAIEREKARKEQNFKKADEIRKKINQLGFKLEDGQKSVKITK